MATASKSWGNPTEPMLQGLPIVSPRFFMKIMDNKKKQNKFFTTWSFWAWPIKILFITITISLVFGLFSEAVLNGSGILISILIILLLYVVSVVSDIIGVSATACDLEPLSAMASRKIKGAKQAIAIVKNADKISSFFCDIIGDICGILSGSASVVICSYLFSNAVGFWAIFTSSLVSAIIAGFMVFLKAIGKNIAVKYPTNVIFTVGKFIGLFSRDKSKNEKKKTEKHEPVEKSKMKSTATNKENNIKKDLK